jgi:hypothetical protein
MGFIHRRGAESAEGSPSNAFFFSAVLGVLCNSAMKAVCSEI